MRVTHPSDDERDVLTVNFGNVGPSENLVCLLDLDYSLIQPDKVQLSDGLAWVEHGHTKIENMFEACITDELRALFEEKR
jgi:uncharacterized protein (TIGR04255 family)